MGKIFQIKWNSFHTKLLATYLLLAALGTSLLAGYILWFFHDYFIESRQIDLDNWTAALGESAADALEKNDLEQVELLVKRYGTPENITLRIFDPQGQLLATSSPEIDRRVENWREVAGMPEALQFQAAYGVTKGVLTNEDRVYVARPIVRDRQLLGVIRMSITLSQFQRQFARVISTTLGSLLLAILLCAVLSDRLARSLSQPIEVMRNFATRLGGGHFGDELAIRQSNELDELAIELNRMSARLASLDQERRTFLANVSHELRTPISNVQVTVEALKNGAFEEANLRDRFLQTIEDETKRLTRLIHDLMDLGRLEAGVVQLECQQMSLNKLLNRAINSMELRMQSAGITTQVNIPTLWLYGDPERLLQAFLNLLDNAIKHSKPGSKIEITGRKDGKTILLEIQDQGAGIQSRDLPHIFEQFYTTDPSRQGKGHGLGLAIAKRIVEAHQGTITANSTYGQGATFTVRLPSGTLQGTPIPAR